MRAADLGVCAPSGTRTPNPLKFAVRLLASMAIALKWALTCSFVALTTLAFDLRFFDNDPERPIMINRPDSFSAGSGFESLMAHP